MRARRVRNQLRQAIMKTSTTRTTEMGKALFASSSVPCGNLHSLFIQYRSVLPTLLLCTAVTLFTAENASHGRRSSFGLLCCTPPRKLEPSWPDACQITAAHQAYHQEPAILRPKMSECLPCNQRTNEAAH